MSLEKCNVTPILSEKKKNKWISILNNVYNKDNRVLDFCPPIKKGINHLWVLPNGKLIQSNGFHAEVEDHLQGLYSDIKKINKNYHSSGYWVQQSVLDMIRLTQSVSDISVDVNIDTNISNSQWKTIKECIEITDDKEAFVDINYPNNNDIWNDDTMKTESGEFYQKSYTNLRKFLKTYQNKKQKYCDVI